MVLIMTTMLAIFFFGVDSAVQRDRPVPARPARLTISSRIHSTMSRWYIIHAYSGFENKVRDAILAEAKRLGPRRSSSRRSRSRPRRSPRSAAARRSQSERKFFPGYVLAKLAMNDDVYHLVKNTPKVTGFLGPNGKPQPITDAEAARILNTKEEAAAAAPKQKIRSIMRSATRSRCSTARSPASTASSRSSISTAAGSRSASRSSAARRRSSWSSSRSSGLSRSRRACEAIAQQS